MGIVKPAEISIVGTGITKFGRFKEKSLKNLGADAISSALTDADLDMADIDMAFVGNAMAAVITGQVSVVGQSIVRAYGFSGIPVFNIDNACASSSSALNLAIQAIRAGTAQTVLVLGVEKMITDDRARSYQALNGAADLDALDLSGIDPTKESVFVTSIYPKRLAVYQGRYGLSGEVLAQIAFKNRSHAARNSNAQFTDPISIGDILSARKIVGPITSLMCSPMSDGAAALIVTARRNVRPKQRAVGLLASTVGMGGVIEEIPAIRRIANLAYQSAGIQPNQIDVAEVHDSTAFNELLAYEELGFCEPGGGARLVAEGATALGGKIPVNTSGGLESRGHPVAATGAAQVVEIVTQLRGEAGERQVPHARIGICENAGGYARDDTAAIVVTVLAT